MNEAIMKTIIEKAKTVPSTEVPIVAAISREDEILSIAHNTKETTNNPCAHAEINAIQEASKKLHTWRLENCDLYVTLEPCLMCAGAIVQSRIRNLYFAAYDPKGGAITSCANTFETNGINHRPAWQGGILEKDASKVLKDFFKKIRS